MKEDGTCSRMPTAGRTGEKKDRDIHRAVFWIDLFCRLDQDACTFEDLKFGSEPRVEGTNEVIR